MHALPSAFRAFRIHKDDGGHRSGVETIGPDDLSEGDLVVREGPQDLRDGARVEIMNRTESTQPSHASRIVEPS